MRIFKSFCKSNSKKERILQEYTEEDSLFGDPSFLSLLSSVFYFRLLSFYLTIFILVVFCTSFYTFRKCSSSFSLGISAVSW